MRYLITEDENGGVVGLYDDLSRAEQGIGWLRDNAKRLRSGRAYTLTAVSSDSIL